MAVPLPFGWTGWEPPKWGLGPGDSSSDPIYTATVHAPTPSDIRTVMDLIVEHGMVVALNFAGGRNGWTDVNSAGCKIYNPSLYESKVRRFAHPSDGGSITLSEYNDLMALIAAGQVIGYTVDEPNIGQFCDSISKKNVNDMGLLHKEIFPGILTAVRSTASVLNGLPTGGFGGEWSGIDYGWYQLNKAGVNSGLTRRQKFAQERTALLQLEMGMIPAYNWVNGGDGRLWDHDRNAGTPDGRIAGPQASVNGGTYWLASPDELRETADAIYDDADAPFFTGFQHTRSGLGSVEPFDVYEYRSDYVEAFQYMLTKLASRPRSNGLRTPKGSPTPPPPPPSGESPIVVVASQTAQGDTPIVPTHAAGDLIVVHAVNEGTGQTPPLAEGFTNIPANGISGLGAHKLAYKRAASSGESGGVWPNASYCEVVVLRNTHPTTPIGADDTQTGEDDSVEYQGLTLTQADGTSKVLAFAFHRAAANVNTPPSGMENIASVGTAAVHITEAGVETWAGGTASVSAAGSWRSSVVEILADPNATVDAEPPSLGGLANRTIAEGSTLTFAASATDPDTDAANLTFSLVSPPTGAAIGASTGVFSWTPTVGQSAGSPYTVTVRVCDDTPLCDEGSFQVTVSAGAPASGGVTRVGSASYSATSGAIPAHQAGDLIVITAVNHLAATIPTMASGFTLIAGSAPGTVGIRTGYKVAVSGAETSGTWTNATSLHITVYRGADPTTPIGASSSAQFTDNTTLRYPGFTFQVNDGSSWVYAAGVSAVGTNYDDVPTGMTNLTSRLQSATHDTNGGVASWGTINLTMSASGATRTHVVEIRADPSSTGEAPVLAAIGNQSVREQDTISFTASADDVDTVPENLTYSLDASAPVWASIDADTGAFIATPPAGAASGSPYSVTVTVSDGSHTDSETISITVTAPSVHSGVRGGGLTTPRQRSTQGASSAS